MESSQLFAPIEQGGCGWTVSDFVAKLEFFSFNVKYAYPDTNTKTAFDTVVRGDDMENIVVVQCIL